MALTIEVCLTPELIHQHQLKGKIAVVVDVFRATSCIITALAENVKAVYPVSTVAECLTLGAQGMLTAGERGGIKIENFDLGNSPFGYMGKVAHKEVAISTTNGTLALSKSTDADQIIIGAFLNISATASYLLSQKLPLVIHCAGWKGTPNLEDTLYAGSLISKLIQKSYSLSDDSAQMAYDLYQINKNDLIGAAEKSGHAQRLARFGVTKDIAFCIQNDYYPLVIGKMEGGKIIKI